MYFILTELMSMWNMWIHVGINTFDSVKIFLYLFLTYICNYRISLYNLSYRGPT